MSSIKLSKKYGVNPGIPVCFLCNEPKNEVVLFGHIKKKNAWGAIPGTDEPAPHNMVLNKEPCDTCRGYMDQGIILISVRDGESGDNPYRTGGWVVVREEAVERFMEPGDLLDRTKEGRVAFLEDKVWDYLGLPRGGADGEDH